MEPYRVFLGRLISHGQRHLIQKYAVKNRHFIGNTSMDAQLSLIMANMAQVGTGSVIYCVLLCKLVFWQFYYCHSRLHFLKLFRARHTH